MKRFDFTLGKLLDYKDQVLSKEKNDLAGLRSQKVSLEEEIADLEGKLSLSGEEYSVRAAEGMSVNDIVMFKNFHTALMRQINEKQTALKRLEEDISHQLAVVVQASKDVNSLEKLKEKQLEEYKFNLNKSEERFIEEYVSSASLRGNM